MRYSSVLRVGLVLVTSIAFPNFAVAEDEVITVLTEACSGNGFAGTITQGGKSFGFESCKTDDGAHTTVSDHNGQTRSDIHLVMDDDQATISIKIDGVVLDSSTSPEELAAMQQAINATDPDLVTKRLWSELVDHGKDPQSAEMGAIAAQLALYEGFVASSGDCFGCCGWGCAGCTGCYTGACALHDACVRTYGHGHPTCQQLLVVAAVSAWCCQTTWCDVS